MSTMKCASCDGKCCRYFCFEIDEPDSCEEFEDLRWYLLHEGVTIHVDEGDWYISLMNPCSALGPNNLCTIYEDRPLICRKYSMENCDFTGGDYEYDALFEKPEDIEDYARKMLGSKKFDKQREKKRAKLAANGAKKTEKARKKAKGKVGKKSKGKRKA